MSYQEIYNGLNKRASNEQIKKLASIIGMRKSAIDVNRIRQPLPQKEVMQETNAYFNPRIARTTYTQQVPPEKFNFDYNLYLPIIRGANRDTQTYGRANQHWRPAGQNRLQPASSYDFSKPADANALIPERQYMRREADVEAKYIDDLDNFGEKLRQMPDRYLRAMGHNPGAARNAVYNEIKKQAPGAVRSINGFVHSRNEAKKVLQEEMAKAKAAGQEQGKWWKHLF